MKRTLFVLSLLTACTQAAPVDAPAAPVEPTAAVAPTAAPQVAPVPAPFTLTDELLAKYAVYSREMLPATTKAMGVATDVMAKAGTDKDKLEAAAKKDERVQEIGKLSEAALAKSGLTMADIPQITTLTSEYYSRAMVAADAREALAKEEKLVTKKKGKKAKAAPSVMQQVYGKQLDEFEAFKKEYATKHGEETVTILSKHEPEFLAINREMLQAVFKKAGKSK